MGANVQEISSQLMKPPRELVSWNFPLSQIVEEYFELLPEPCKIQYGEAALVIQNSVNAYVRRVEDLYDETRCLSQKITAESSDEQNKTKDHRSRKNAIDFSRFNLLDFSGDIGKNINGKTQEKKSLKLLHRCFSQLENPHTRLHIDVYDIQGEVVGKKYDFRCNQKITKHGSLVEELTPVDFEKVRFDKAISISHSEVSTVHVGRNKSPIFSVESSTQNEHHVLLAHNTSRNDEISKNVCTNDPNESRLIENDTLSNISPEFCEVHQNENTEDSDSDCGQDNCIDNVDGTQNDENQCTNQLPDSDNLQPRNSECGKESKSLEKINRSDLSRGQEEDMEVVIELN